MATKCPLPVPPPTFYRAQERSTRGMRCQMCPAVAQPGSCIFNHCPKHCLLSIDDEREGSRSGVSVASPGPPHLSSSTDGSMNISSLTLWLWQLLLGFHCVFFPLLLCSLSDASSSCTNNPSQETPGTPTLLPEIFMEQESLTREATLWCQHENSPHTWSGGGSFPLLFPQPVPEEGT